MRHSVKNKLDSLFYQKFISELAICAADVTKQFYRRIKLICGFSDAGKRLQNGDQHERQKERLYQLG